MVGGGLKSSKTDPFNLSVDFLVMKYDTTEPIDEDLKGISN